MILFKITNRNHSIRKALSINKPCKIGVVQMNDKHDEILTNAPERPIITINTAADNVKGNKYAPGDSVNEYEHLKDANAILAKDEIQQQNENL